MDKSEIQRIGEIDRSEDITLGYVFKGGKLVAEEVDWKVPRWPEDGPSEFSVPARIEDWVHYLDAGGMMLGAFDGDRLVGFVILRFKLTEDMAQLAVMHISKDYRRKGIAARLTKEVEKLAKEDGARELYVSATPSESAVGFYMNQGFRLVEKVNRELYELEPEDIHMIKSL